MTRLIKFLVPTYNRCNILKLNLRKNLIRCRSLKRKLIVIDNGSDDDTKLYCSHLVNEFSADFLYLRNPYNLGLGYSVWKGLLAADGLCFLLSDEDLISDSISDIDLDILETVIEKEKTTLLTTGIMPAQKNNSFSRRCSKFGWDKVNYFEDGYLSGVVLNIIELSQVKPANYCDPRNLYPHLTSYLTQEKQIYRWSQQFVCTNDHTLGRDYLSKEWFTGKSHWHHSSVVAFIVYIITTLAPCANLFDAISTIHYQYFLANKKLLPISPSIIGISLGQSPQFFLQIVLCYIETIKKVFSLSCKKLIP
jgi:glycosyltransferase involved in cell wall biosynthesis